MKNKIIYSFIVCGLAIAIYSCQPNPYAQGQALYINNCQSCHQDDGKAFKKLIPPLANSDFLQKEKDRLACMIKYGMTEEIVVNGVDYKGFMGAADHLSDVEITNIINYINNSWGNKNGYTSLESVQTNLKNCEK